MVHSFAGAAATYRGQALVAVLQAAARLCRNGRFPADFVRLLGLDPRTYGIA
jgi:hypothetical protein